MNKKLQYVDITKYYLRTLYYPKNI